MTQPSSNPDSLTRHDIARFLVGDADTIRRLASRKATFVTGAILVLFTTVARHYDQMWIGENPVVWFIGPLLFSLVSGTWLFMVVYLGYMRSRWPEAPEFRKGAWNEWPDFMGLFWMTAPIGWLYALPVERVLTPVASAWANVALLALVSLWRVALFSRVISVVARVRYLDALTWVLVAISVETFVVLFFGSFGLAVGRAMAGLRYSPVEEVMMGTVNIAMTGAMILGPAALLVSAWRRSRIPMGSVARLTPPFPGRPPWLFLGGCAAFWALLALLAQPAVHRSAHLDALVDDRKYPEALEYLRRQRPDRFAPSRPLPPKGYEFRTTEELAGLLSNLHTNDPAWIQDHLLGRLDVMAASQRPRWNKPKNPDVPSPEDYWVWKPEKVELILTNILKFAAGREWIQRHGAFVEAVRQRSQQESGRTPVHTNNAAIRTPLASPVPPPP